MALYDTVQVDVSGLDGELQRMASVPGKLQRAIRLALNTVGRRVRTISWREVRDEINLKPSYIRNEVNFIPATADELRVIIYARKKGVTLSQFPHKQLYRRGKDGRRVKAGIRVRVSSSDTELIQGAFIAPIGPAGGLIVERIRKPRLPVEVLHGPSPSQVLNTKLDDIGEQAEALLADEIERQLARADL
ncbi:phage tail protein [Halopseudomonas aestusnigri]|uniref:phage tail protein n=1 Tax=Halopseudomonas aestusnigri TaxID=857252 RepID=UPI0030025560